MTRTYTELSGIEDYYKRYEYLKLSGAVGEETFGHERYVNQKFYRSAQWRAIRDFVIVRDNGCELGFPGREIPGRIIVHHMNPMTRGQLRALDLGVLDPEQLISVSHGMHNAIHYGTIDQIEEWTERSPGDTLLWSR